MLYAVPTNIWSCTPIERFWHPQLPGHCIDYYSQSLIVATWDVVLDFVILVLPMPKVFRLRLGLGRKLLTATAFLAGYWYAVFFLLTFRFDADPGPPGQRLGRLDRPPGRKCQVHRPRRHKRK